MQQHGKAVAVVLAAALAACSSKPSEQKKYGAAPWGTGNDLGPISATLGSGDSGKILYWTGSAWAAEVNSGGLSTVTTASPITGTGSAGSAVSFSPTLGSGLQGIGSSGSPLDITAGTTNGQQPMWNGTAWSIDDDCSNPSKRYCMFNDFEQGNNCTQIYGVGGYLGASSGTGATCTFVTNTTGHPGVLSMQTGSTNAGYSRISQGNWVVLGNNEGTWIAKTLVAISQLGTSNENIAFRGGFNQPSTGADSSNAVEFYYEDSGSTPYWGLRACAAGTCTSSTCNGTSGTGTESVVANTWYTLTITVNGAGNSATLQVNNDAVCTTITTNIPTTSTHTTSVGLQCAATGGASASNTICYVDYQRVSLPFGTAR